MSNMSYRVLATAGAAAAATTVAIAAWFGEVVAIVGMVIVVAVLMEMVARDVEIDQGGNQS